jgi:hypothetical protein
MRRTVHNFWGVDGDLVPVHFKCDCEYMCFSDIWGQHESEIQGGEGQFKFEVQLFLWSSPNLFWHAL